MQARCIGTGVCENDTIYLLTVTPGGSSTVNNGVISCGAVWIGKGYV